MSPPPHDPDRTSARLSPGGAVDFPPPGPTPAPAALADLARASMEAEWAAGNPVPAEWYFAQAQAPALAADPSAALDIVFLEFVLRDEAGEAPTASQFAVQFPALEDSLRRLVELDSALGTDGAGETSPAPADPDYTRPYAGRSAGSVGWDDSYGCSPAADPKQPAVRDLLAPTPSDRPAAIGRYLVVEFLGRGGQAEAFLGVHPVLGREVVIKRLRGRTTPGG